MDLSLLQGQAFQANGLDTANSRGTSVTAGGSANTKGSWTEIVASTARAYHAFLLVIGTATSNLEFLIDVGIGAGGSEQIIVPDFYWVNGNSPYMLGQVIRFDIPIPAGTRIAVRTQSNTASGAALFTLVGLSYGFGQPPKFSAITAYGAATGDTGGVSIDPGGAANTKGSWVEIVASTGRPTKQIYLVLGAQNNFVRTSATYLLDIGIGAGGSEQIVIPDLPVFQTNGADILSPVVIGPLPLSIPAGTRIAARAQCSITDATDRLFDLIVYGVD